MKNSTYYIAIFLVVVWAIGFFFYNAGGFIHILLAVALLSILTKIILGPKRI